MRGDLHVAIRDEVKVEAMPVHVHCNYTCR